MTATPIPFVVKVGFAFSLGFIGVYLLSRVAEWFRGRYPRKGD